MTFLTTKNQVLILKLCNHLIILQLVKSIVMKQNLMPTWDEALERFNNEAHEV